MADALGFAATTSAARDGHRRGSGVGEAARGDEICEKKPEGCRKVVLTAG